MNKAWRLLWLMVCFCALPLSLFAQTTGSIAGRVTDDSQAALPGVTVEISSPALQGTRTAETDTSGNYRVPLLPPGTYKLTFTITGFATATADEVAVGLGRDTTLNQVMYVAKTSEVVNVEAEAAVIDTESTRLGANVTERQIDTLPTERNYSSVVEVVPGTSSDANRENSQQSTITVYGSSGAENSYYIDGINTTGVEYGFQGKDLNFEFIQDVDVKTGGYEAEYGKSTGGIINVITKSGGNAYHGDIFTYYDTDSLQSNPAEIVSPSGTVSGFTKKDYGADFSGYVLKDKLWFFGAFDRVSNATSFILPAPQAGDIVPTDTTRNLGAFKVTYNIKEGHSLVWSYFQDPRTDTGAINDADHTLNGQPATYLGEQDYGGRDFGLLYNGVSGTKWLFSGQVSRHGEQNSVGPADPSADIVEYRDAQNNFYQTGGFGLIQDKTFSRTSFGGAVTRLMSNHQFKGGLEYEIENADVIKRMSGGQRVDVYGNAVDPAQPIYSHFYWTTPTATIDNAPLSELNGSPQHKNTTAYLQDKWDVKRNFTINAGLRWDRQEIFDRFGAKVIDLKGDFAPRLGFIWDPKNDTKSRIYGSYGRYYESIPMDLVIRSFMQERQARIINFDPVSIAPNATAENDFGTPSAILGGYSEPADPHLKGQYLNEYVLGFDRQVKPKVSVGIKGIYRSYGRIIEDFLCDSSGDYCIGNPGEGIMKDVFALDYVHTFPAPKPVRKYTGLEFDVTRQFSNNWQVMASYIVSKLRGNYDGEYAPFTNVGADPNISAMYDYYDFFTNGTDLSKITNFGPLSNDRRHEFKFSSIYFTPWKFSVGFVGYLKSGLPITPMGYSDSYGRYEYFLLPRGAGGRTPWIYDADMHVGYPLTMGNISLNLFLDVFDIFNAQRPILLDERWGFQQADNSSPTPVNPNYLRPVLRTPPTSARLGVRLSF